MTKKKILQEIQTVLIQMGIAPKAITQQATYNKDLGLDSLDISELMMEFELRFNFQIPCTAFENIKTIKDTIEYISQQKEKATN